MTKVILLDPAVAKVCRESYDDGNMRFLTFVGTETELLEARVASLEMFRRIGKSRAHSGGDEFGDKYQIRGFADGRFELIRFFRNEASENLGPGRGWRALGEGVRQVVTEAIERARQSKRQASAQ